MILPSTVDPRGKCHDKLESHDCTGSTMILDRNEIETSEIWPGHVLICRFLGILRQPFMQRQGTLMGKKERLDRIERADGGFRSLVAPRDTVSQRNGKRETRRRAGKLEQVTPASRSSLDAIRHS